MSASWLVPELVTTDFTADFEDLLIPYIKTKYTITNPNQTDIEHFKIRVGFFDFSVPYEIVALQADTRPEQWGNAGRWVYASTGIIIAIRMERISRDKVDPQLGNMEREIIRIAGQYRPGEIPGIKKIMWDGGERIYNADDDYAASDWRSLVRVRVYYEKVDVSLPQ